MLGERRWSRGGGGGGLDLVHTRPSQMDNYCWHYSSRIRLSERERGGGVQGGEKKMVKINPLLQLAGTRRGTRREKGTKRKKSHVPIFLHHPLHRDCELQSLFSHCFRAGGVVKMVFLGWERLLHTHKMQKKKTGSATGGKEGHQEKSLTGCDKVPLETKVTAWEKL